MNNVYADIDELPIYNWFKVHATGDYSFVMIKKRKADSKMMEKLSAHWKVLYDQYLQMFGFADNFLMSLDLQKEIALRKIEKAETGDETIQTFIEIMEHELIRKQKENSNTSNFYEIKSFVEKQIKFQINIRQTSVVEFFTMLKSIA